MSNQAKPIMSPEELVGVGAPVGELGDGVLDPAAVRARPIPRISIQAFCENGATAEIIQIASEDRRLAKAHVSVHMGGIEAAVAHYQQNPTPNLIIIESSLPRDHILAELDRLAENCDPGTKVLVIGHVNDVMLYRELLKRGVSEYLVEPIDPMQLMEAISNLYNNPDTEPVGHVYAFIGAKGGVGSSTICHNAAWALSEILKADVVIADLDLAFGTTGLDFNQDPMQGIADALSSPDRLDEVLLDRLLTKCSEHLSIFAAPGRARSRLRPLGGGLRSGHRRRAPERALRGGRPAAHVDGVVEEHPAAGRRGDRHRRAGPRQPAQRQEHRRPAADSRGATTASRVWS